MKSHPHLLVRDALAGLFVRASEGDAANDHRLDALLRWSDEGASSPELHELVAEDGTPLFLSDGRLDPRFEGVADYVRERARRFETARARMRAERAERSPLGRAGAAWDAGLYFEVHEILEPVWLADRGSDRDALQGLIMAAAALHHLVEGRAAGAVGLCREGARRLRRATDRFPLAVEALVDGLEEIAARIDRGEVRSARDLGAVPPLRARARGPV